MLGKGKISIGKINFNVSLNKLTNANDNKSGSEHLDEQQIQLGEFGKFSSSKVLSQEADSGSYNDINIENEGELSISKSMGFSSFGKSARVFDIEKLAEQTKKAAFERNRERLDFVFGIGTPFNEVGAAVVKGIKDGGVYDAPRKKGFVYGCDAEYKNSLSGFGISMKDVPTSKLNRKFGFVEEGIDVCERILRNKKKFFPIKHCGLVI